MITKIQVKQIHINTGEKEDCRFCPVALALSDAMPEFCWEVRRHWIVINNELIKMPIIVQDFISAFDSGQPVEPFEFELETARIECKDLMEQDFTQGVMIEEVLE